MSVHDSGDALEEPGIVEDDADGTFPFGIFLAVTTCHVGVVRSCPISGGWNGRTV